MKGLITDILHERRTILSFEVFPPKKADDSDLNVIFNTIKKLSRLKPDFISVTYKTRGRNKKRAIDISEFIRKNGIIPLSHLTAVGYSKDDVLKILDEFYQVGVRNILALRGDIDKGISYGKGTWKDFKYAKDLIEFIKSDGRFCIGAATYPEGHVECKDVDKTIDHLGQKSYAGVDFFITQLFFDNQVYYRFLNKAMRAGINKPIIPGIMPVLRAGQIKKMVRLSGASVPNELNKLLDRYGEDTGSMRKAGIEYAARQIDDLLSNGVKGIHLYTMNKARSVMEIVKQVSLR
ncbi:MAG: methylenetetrahydrofolate reductase [Thermotogae bacterium]|nr:methylenetetrahydrofolate reductase [Thermotogota bacterium]